MHYLSIGKGEIEEKGGFNTASEIAGQLALWAKTASLIKSKRVEIDNFLNLVLPASAKRNNAPVKFAASLNQVDTDGGYTGMTI